MFPLEEAKTGENIRREILKILVMKFGLHASSLNKIVWVTDEGANIKLALRPYQRLDYIDHVLNTVLRHGLDIRVIKTRRCLSVCVSGVSNWNATVSRMLNSKLSCINGTKTGSHRKWSYRTCTSLQHSSGQNLTSWECCHPQTGMPCTPMSTLFCMPRLKAKMRNTPKSKPLFQQKECILLNSHSNVPQADWEDDEVTRYTETAWKTKWTFLTGGRSTKHPTQSLQSLQDQCYASRPVAAAAKGSLVLLDTPSVSIELRWSHLQWIQSFSSIKTM